MVQFGSVLVLFGSGLVQFEFMCLLLDQFWYSVGSVGISFGSVGSVLAQCCFTSVRLVQFWLSLADGWFCWFKCGSV